MTADAVLSLGVVIAGVVIMYTGRTWLDPAVSLVLVVVIVVGTWSLLRESIQSDRRGRSRRDRAAVAEAWAGGAGSAEYGWAGAANGINRGPDIEGEIRFLAMVKGGRQSAVRSGDTPAHRIHDNYQMFAGHMHPDVERVELGASNGGQFSLARDLESEY
jgi:hypothetical protein